MCVGRVPLWAHGRDRARRDKVGLACAVAARGLCSGRKQGGTLLLTFLWGVGKGMGGLVSAPVSSTGLLC